MSYDVTVIGSGPGGYVAAIRCAQLGMKTALIERYPTLGGTCLNVGCIPSKALLDSSEHYHHAAHAAKEHGIEISGLRVNWPQMLKRKSKVVSTIGKGIEFLMKKNQIAVFTGHGCFVDAQHLVVRTADGTEQPIETQRTIIATGSKPSSLPGITIDQQRVISSTEALSLPTLPQQLVIIGGGIIGVELGSVYARLGVAVTIVEYLPMLIPTMDHDLGAELLKSLKRLGITCALDHQVTGVQVAGETVTVSATAKAGKTVSFRGDYCLVAVGRQPYTQGLGLDTIGVPRDERGRIVVNEQLETEVRGIYAIGDVVRGPMLAHKAEEEGVFVAEVMAGQQPYLHYHLIPSVAYTWPEVAAVGATEQELQTAGRAYKKGQFPFMALGRARASGDLDGFVKVLADPHTDEILGVHMIGARVADIINEAVVAMEYRASAEDIARCCHAHPTFSEALKEACLAATSNRALNA